MLWLLPHNAGIPPVGFNAKTSLRNGVLKEYLRYELCSWGLLPSCHGSFPASSCVHSVHETLLSGFHRLPPVFKATQISSGLVVVAGADLRQGMQCLLIPIFATSTPRERRCFGGASACAFTTTERALANQARRLFTIIGSMLLPVASSSLPRCHTVPPRW